jgi:hypothetical protein
MRRAHQAAGARAPTSCRGGLVPSRPPGPPDPQTRGLGSPMASEAHSTQRPIPNRQVGDPADPWRTSRVARRADPRGLPSSSAPPSARTRLHRRRCQDWNGRRQRRGAVAAPSEGSAERWSRPRRRAPPRATAERLPGRRRPWHGARATSTIPSEMQRRRSSVNARCTCPCSAQWSAPTNPALSANCPSASLA